MDSLNESMTFGIGVTSFSTGNYDVITETEKEVLTTPSTSSTALIVTQGVLYGILLTLGMMFNCCVVWLIRHKRSLHTVTNMWVTSLCMSQVLICAISLPIIVLSVMADDWLLGSVFCRIFGFYTTCLRTVSILSVAGIALDRYHIVTRPFSVRIRKSSARILILLTWWCGIFASIPPLFGIGLYRYSPNSHMCGVSWSLGGSALVFTAFYVTSVYILALMTTTFSYKFIYQVTKAQARKRKRPSVAGGLGSSVASSRSKRRHSYDYANGANTDDEGHPNTFAGNKKASPAKRRLTTVQNGKLNRSGGSLRNRLSTSFSLGYSHSNIDNRAALTIGLVFITFISTWLPYFTFGLYSAISTMSMQSYSANSWVEFFTTWLSFSNVIWDPLLYGAFNHNFRTHLREWYCCIKINRIFQKSRQNLDSGDIYDDTHRHRTATVAANWREIIKNEEKEERENVTYGRGGVALIKNAMSESANTMTSLDGGVILSSPTRGRRLENSSTGKIFLNPTNEENDGVLPTIYITPIVTSISVTSQKIDNNSNLTSRDRINGDDVAVGKHAHSKSTLHEHDDVTKTDNMTSSNYDLYLQNEDTNSKFSLPMIFNESSRTSSRSNLSSFRLNERMSSLKRYKVEQARVEKDENNPNIFFTQIDPKVNEIKSTSQAQLSLPTFSSRKLNLKTFSSNSTAAISSRKSAFTPRRRLSNESGRIRRQKVRAPPSDKFHDSKNVKNVKNGKLYQSATAL